MPDTSDAFPCDPTESADTHGDGIGNNADTDDDNDGKSDADESACGSDPSSAGRKSADFDNDNSPDCFDSDDDDSPGKVKVMMGQEKAHGPNNYRIADRHRPPHPAPVA